MYFAEMTKAAAVIFIREIAENAPNDYEALDLICAFIENEMTTTEIEKIMY